MPVWEAVKSKKWGAGSLTVVTYIHRPSSPPGVDTDQKIYNVHVHHDFICMYMTLWSLRQSTLLLGMMANSICNLWGQILDDNMQASILLNVMVSKCMIQCILYYHNVLIHGCVTVYCFTAYRISVMVGLQLCRCPSAVRITCRSEIVAWVRYFCRCVSF